MSRLFYHVMQDNLGNLLFDVTGTMRLAGSGTLATIYGDEALTVVLPNPMTNHPSFGSFKCFLGAGDYDFYMAKGGYTFETLTGVQGHGTMAQQDANAVAITGGSAVLGSLMVDNPTLLVDPALNSVGFGTTPQAGRSLMAASAEVLGTLTVANTALLVDGTSKHVGIGTAPQVNETFAVGGTTFFNGHMGLMERYGAAARLSILEQRGTAYGIQFDTTADGGGTGPCTFRNSAGTEVGYIGTSATATTYSTASDSRLKHAVTALTGALDAIAALRPVAFRWNADDSQGHGFLAHELQVTIPDAVTGLPDEVNPDGTIRPQGVDHSKMVPWLVGAIQEMAQRLEIVEAQLAALTAS